MKKGYILFGFVGLAALGLLAWGLVDARLRYNTTLAELQALQTAVAGGRQPVPQGSAEPFTIAFVSDTETLSRWDDVLEFIREEGAQMLVHQGDYVDGTNPETMQPSTFAALIGEEVLDDEGNPTGEFNCRGPLQGVRCILGADFPMLGSAVGKSLPPELEGYYLRNLAQIENQGGEWGGCVKVGSRGDEGVRMEGCFTDDNLANSRAADYWVRWKGVSLVFQNVMPDTTWAQQALEKDQNIWKLCLWHGNHLDFQTGEKGAGYDGRDHSLPYEMYRNCADMGALIINGNEHTYSRTCILEDIGNLGSGGPSGENRVNRGPSGELQNHGAVCQSAGMPNDRAANTVEELEIGPGRSMVIVSAVPGYAWRDYRPEVESLLAEDTLRHRLDGWWATMFTHNRYCRNNCTQEDLSAQNEDAFVPGMNPPSKVKEPPDAPWDPYSDGHGVLFITFNYEGDPYRAHGVFKKLIPDPDSGRQIVDEFIITYVP